jgi:hypothetical protein
MNFRKEQSEFVLQQCLINSINAAFRLRKAGSIYEKNSSQSERLRLRQDFAKAIIAAAEKVLTVPIGEREATLIAVIEDIVMIFENLKDHKHILKDGRFYFGVVQKALNLFLKYLWCLDMPNLSKHPPHCPIDSQVLAEIQKSDEKWFCLNKEKYIFVIDEIRKKAKSIAKWELGLFKSSIKFHEEFDFGIDFSIYSALLGNC